jgi:hypothetical protein
MSEILSYRGLLAEGTQDRILLSTKKGEAGYKIVRLELFPHQPGHTVNYESVVQVFTTSQSSIPASGATVDFSDTTLLAAAYYQDNNNDAYPSSLDVIFDKITFNQDIFITLTDNASGGFMNYHIELERVKLSEHEAMVTTIQSIRNG